MSAGQCGRTAPTHLRAVSGATSRKDPTVQLIDPAATSLIEALHSTPSRRFLSPEPIPDEVIWAILDAAVRGPTGGNRQAWGWVVVTDPAIKHPA